MDYRISDNPPPPPTTQPPTLKLKPLPVLASGRVNFANSVPVESPDLISFRDPPVQTHNITDGGTGGVATSIADKDGIWRAGPSDIGMAATHANRRVTSSSSYLPRLAIRGICGYMLLRDRPNQGGGVLCWWRWTLSAIDAEAKRGIDCKLWGSIMNIQNKL